MSDDARTFTWPRTPAVVDVPDDHERRVAELFDAMMACDEVDWHRQAIARDGARRVAGVELLDWLGCGGAHTDGDAAERVVDGVWRRDALGYETNADELVGCVAVVTVDDAFTRYGWTDPPAAADLDADLDNDEGTQP